MVNWRSGKVDKNARHALATGFALAVGTSTLAGMPSRADDGMPSDVAAQHASMVAMFGKARHAASVCSPIFMSVKPLVACLYQVEWHGQEIVPRAWSMGVHFQAFMDMSDIGDSYMAQTMTIDHDITVAFHGNLSRFCNYFELDCGVFTLRFMNDKRRWGDEIVKSSP